MPRTTKKPRKTSKPAATKPEPVVLTPFEIPAVLGFDMDNGDPRLTSLWLKGYGWIVGGARTSAVRCSTQIRILPETDSQPFVKDTAELYQRVKQAFLGFDYYQRRGHLFPVGGDENAT